MELPVVQHPPSVPVGPLTRFAPLNSYDSDGNPHSLSSDIEQGVGITALNNQSTAPVASKQRIPTAPARFSILTRHPLEPMPV